jgi:catechol 2,3-dioxygenase-like lactoylglutathione lyase family enzyme
MLNSVTPFFIIDDLDATIAFYQSKLGFDVRYKGGSDGIGPDFFAIVGRDRVMLNFKAITPEIHPQPNHSRHEWARWDAYVHTDDPDSLYKEFTGRQVPIHRELANTSDGLRAFDHRQQWICAVLWQAGGEVGDSGWIFHRASFSQFPI